MRDLRPAALALLALLLLAAGAWAWSMRPDAGGAESAQVTVQGPGGGTYWSGTVPLRPGDTVLAALQEAGRQGGFGVTVEPHALGAYVTAIGPHAETATGGWNYCVDSGAGYRWAPAAADARGISPGERVLWLWVEGGAHSC